MNSKHVLLDGFEESFFDKLQGDSRPLEQVCFPLCLWVAQPYGCNQ